MFVLISHNAISIRAWFSLSRTVPYIVELLMLPYSQNAYHYGVRHPKNQCWWAGDEARGNFLKELGIVTSEITESKWGGGKETSFREISGEDIYWDARCCVGLISLYLISLPHLQSSLLRTAPQTGSTWKGKKNRDTERGRQRSIYPHWQRRKSGTECQTNYSKYTHEDQGKRKAQFDHMLN